MVGFDVTPEVTQDFTDNTELLAHGVHELHPGGGTALYDALYFACRDKLLKSPKSTTVRRAIILLSDGDDNQSHVTREEAIEMAQRAEAVVYTISTNVSGTAGPGRQGARPHCRCHRRTPVPSVPDSRCGERICRNPGRTAQPVRNLLQAARISSRTGTTGRSRSRPTTGRISGCGRGAGGTLRCNKIRASTTLRLRSVENPHFSRKERARNGAPDSSHKVGQRPMCTQGRLRTRRFHEGKSPDMSAFVELHVFCGLRFFAKRSGHLRYAGIFRNATSEEAGDQVRISRVHGRGAARSAEGIGRRTCRLRNRA